MTVAKATRRITKLRVREMSLVGEGDNPHADVLILKHRQAVGIDFNIVAGVLGEVRKSALQLAHELSEGGSSMDIQELTDKLDNIEKSLTAAQEQNTALRAQVTDLTGQLTAVTKERDEAVEKAKAPANDTDEEVLKGLPEPLRQRFIAAEARAVSVEKALAEANDQRELAAEVEKVRAAGFKDADTFGALVHRVRKGKSTSEDADKLNEFITKAAAVVKGDSVLFTAIGKAKGIDPDAAATAQGQLDEAVTAVLKAKPLLTREQAITEVFEAQPGLYDEIQKARSAS
jgi:hypothetical protein